MSNRGFELTVVTPYKKKRCGSKIEMNFTVFKTPTGFHYTTGFWHAWLVKTPKEYKLFIQKKCQSDDFKTSTFMGSSFGRSAMEFKMAELLWEWSR